MFQYLPCVNKVYVLYIYRKIERSLLPLPFYNYYQCLLSTMVTRDQVESTILCMSKSNTKKELCTQREYLVILNPTSTVIEVLNIAQRKKISFFFKIIRDPKVLRVLEGDQNIPISSLSKNSNKLNRLSFRQDFMNI